jgi:hypothetical protein
MATRKTTISGMEVNNGATMEPIKGAAKFNWLAIHSMALVNIRAAMKKTSTMVPRRVNIVSCHSIPALQGF